MTSPSWVEMGDTTQTTTRKVDLYGLELFFQDDETGDPWSAPKGTLYTDALTAILSEVLGPERVSVTPSVLTMTEDVVIQRGIKKTELISKVAEPLNYWALRFTMDGTAVMSPYVRPQDRPVLHTWSVSEEWYKDAVQVEDDGWTVPNVLTGFSQDDPPLTYTAYNWDKGPYCRNERGRWKAGEPLTIDTHDMRTLQFAVDRSLAASINSSRKVTLEVAEHDIRGNEAVQIQHGNLDVQLGVITGYKETDKTGEVITVEVSEVIA